MDILEIIDECLRCKTYRNLERVILKTDRYEYSVSEEVQEALEEADPTGRALEAKCTNLKEIEEEDSINEGLLHQHVLSCDAKGCTSLRGYRHDLGIMGY